MSDLIELPRGSGFLLVDPTEVCAMWEIEWGPFGGDTTETQIVLRAGVTLTASQPLAETRAALGI